MRDPLPERCPLGEFRVEVMRKKVPAVPGMNHEIRFRDRPPVRLAYLTDDVVFKKECLFHAISLF